MADCGIPRSVPIPCTLYVQYQIVSAQGALALLGTQGPDTAGAPAGRSSAAARRYGPGARRALSGRVAALEPYIQERCVGISLTLIGDTVRCK